jgi:hypothetical protein
MFKQVFGITLRSAIALFAILAFSVSLAMAQTSLTAPDLSLATAVGMPFEGSTVQTAPATTGPISLNFTLKKINGTLNLLVDPDGTYNFSGTVGKDYKDKDFDVTLVLKSTKTGALITFHYVGDDTHGITFSKQGKNDVLKDNFATFASGHKSEWHYRFYESKAGLKAIYEAQEAKKAKLRQEEKEAKEKHEAQKAAEKKAELKDEELAEMKWELKQSSKEEKNNQSVVVNNSNNNNNSNSGGGSGGGGGILGDVMSVAGPLLACL